MMKKKQNNAAIDDGRTISDMTEIVRHSRMHYIYRTMTDTKDGENRQQQTKDTCGENTSFTKEERMAVFRGAMKATALVGAAYVCGFALLIGLLYLIFG